MADSLRLREEFLETSTELGIVDYAAEQARNGNRLVVFAQEVPRALNGKIDYAAVRALLAGRLRPR